MDLQEKSLGALLKGEREPNHINSSKYNIKIQRQIQGEVIRNKQAIVNKGKKY